MQYHYRVRDPLGKTHEGTLEAHSPEDATQQLRRDGFHVLQLDEAEADGFGLLGPRVGKREIIYVTNQLAVMVDTGITLSSALGAIGEQEANPSLRKVLAEIQTAVEGGEDFSAALARYPRLFDKTYCALVKAAEATGSLGTMLDRLAGYLRSEVDTRAKVRAALAYPAAMLLLACGVTVFLLTYILPKFMPLFKSKHVDLPKPTLIMMAVSDTLRGYWYWWLGALVAAVVGFLYGRRTETGRCWIDWAKINAPLLGPMFRKVTISRSIRALGTMIGSGVPILDAVRLAGEVSGNCYYERIWQNAVGELAAGKRLCDVLRQSPLFPPPLVQMIGAGEETARLEAVLEKVSDYYDREVEAAVKATTSLIEPIMIGVMGLIVGTIGLSVLLPIFSLSRHP